MTDAAAAEYLPCSVALVGLMGAGKSAVGARLAQHWGVPFTDTDSEVERAAGMSIADIFELHGESAFRDCERRVIARLLDGPAQVLATGGGAFVQDATRALIAERAVTVWLKAGLDTLERRTQRRGHRPLLQTEDPRARLAQLAAERDPLYAGADVHVATDDRPLEATVAEVADAVAARLGPSGGRRAAPEGARER